MDEAVAVLLSLATALVYYPNLVIFYSLQRKNERWDKVIKYSPPLAPWLTIGVIALTLNFEPFSCKSRETSEI